LPPLAIPFEGQPQARSARPARFEEEISLLFDAWRNGLLRYLLSSGLSLEDGEEVVQEIFFALFQHLVDRKPRTHLRGWVFRVAHNLGLKRRIAANKRMEISLDSEAGVHADSALDPEQQAAAAQRQTRLESLVRALPEQDRCCLALRAEGLRYREIGEILGVSLGSVAASLARSLRRIARADKG